MEANFQLDTYLITIVALTTCVEIHETYEFEVPLGLKHLIHHFKGKVQKAVSYWDKLWKLSWSGRIACQTTWGWENRLAFVNKLIPATILPTAACIEVDIIAWCLPDQRCPFLSKTAMDRKKIGFFLRKIALFPKKTDSCRKSTPSTWVMTISTPRCNYQSSIGNRTGTRRTSTLFKQPPCATRLRPWPMLKNDNDDNRKRSVHVPDLGYHNAWLFSVVSVLLLRIMCKRHGPRARATQALTCFWL